MKRKTFSRLKSALWFLVKLNVLAVPLYLVSYYGLAVPQFQDAWAYVLSGALSLSGIQNALDGHSIWVSSQGSIQQVYFSWDSTGWKSLYAMCALVFASGVGTTERKLRFLALALPLVLAVNFLRTFSTSVFSVYAGFQYFDFVHGVLWSGMMVAFVIAVWYLMFFVKRDNKG